ncbi:MAG: DUF2188 domain-containing protein [Bacilli bacterium]|nr:DUF2188 domain-containing protein [Bacilli bacterium]
MSKEKKTAFQKFVLALGILVAVAAVASLAVGLVFAFTAPANGYHGMFSGADGDKPLLAYARFCNAIRKALVGETDAYVPDEAATSSLVFGVICCVLGLIWLIMAAVKKKFVHMVYFLAAIATGFVVSFGFFLATECEAYHWKAGWDVGEGPNLLATIVIIASMVLLVAFIAFFVLNLISLIKVRKPAKKAAEEDEEEEAVEEPKKEEKPAEEAKPEVKEEPVVAAEPEVKEEPKEEPKVEEQPKEEPKEEPAPAPVEEKPAEEKKEEKPAEEKKPAAKKAPAKKPAEKKEPAKKEEAPKAEPKKEPAKKAEPKKAEPKKEAAPKAEKKPAEKPAPKAEEKPAAAKGEKPTPRKDAPRSYHISQHPNGGWQVKGAGSEKALKRFPTQAEAIKYARELEKSSGVSFRVHSMKGKIRKA